MIRDKKIFRGSVRRATLDGRAYLVNKYGCVWREQSQEAGGYWCIAGKWYDNPPAAERDSAIARALGEK